MSNEALREEFADFEQQRLLDKESNQRRVEGDSCQERGINLRNEERDEPERCVESSTEARRFFLNDDPPSYESVVVSNNAAWTNSYSPKEQCLHSSALPETHLEGSLFPTRSTISKYGVILIATVVIISLMALSLLVRCIVGKSFW